nr:unnamed protein product [Callosobruchus analis]
MTDSASVLYKIAFSLILLQTNLCFCPAEHSYETKTLDVPLDHYTFSSNKTFKLRYLITSKCHIKGGPVFVYTGNEADIELFARNTGFIFDMASVFNALVRTKENDGRLCNEIPICKKAFLSLHGITSARLRRLQQSICDTLKSPCDGRGKHNSRPNSLPIAITNTIEEHIKSYKPRQSHYSLRQTPIFGLPRTDTCSTFDSLIQKIAAADSDQLKTSLNAEKELYLRKAQAFYDLNRKWKENARRGEAMIICFDFMQNLPLSHVRDNLAFGCRQLWYYVFGIHNLKDDGASMYVYDESIGKKGQNEVTSLLFHYLTKGLDVTSRHLVLFSDGCPGQNKNCHDALPVHAGALSKLVRHNHLHFSDTWTFVPTERSRFFHYIQKESSSYGGMLAAWLRMKYPTSVIGAIASSAPIWYFSDQVPCNKFYEKVTDVFQTYGGDECVDVIKMSWKVIRNLTREEKGNVRK